MAQVLTAKLISEDSAEPGKESYEITWTIPNWLLVRSSEVLVNCQEAVFETGSSPTAWFKTKWLVGLKVIRTAEYYNLRKIRMYWKLLGISGVKGPQAMRLEAKLQTQLWNFSGNTPKYTDEQSQEVKLLGIVVEANDCAEFSPSYSYSDMDIVGVLGSVMYNLKLTLKTPTMSSSEYDCFKMEQFSKTSVEQLRQNLTAMLNDQSKNADLKIFTSDGVEIQAHKNILQARCPVFAAMLNCELSENATGIIRMTDITGETMKILLHYFYVGELLPAWRHPGIIVEFTYAAGKYQMTEVLKLLDDMLGKNTVGDASNLDVQLINLAGKLNLEKAETRLLERIVAKIKKVGTGGELFELFGYEEQEILELAENLANDKVGESRILRLIDYLCGDKIDSEDLNEKGMPLLALIRKEEHKTAEKKLLKRFCSDCENMATAEELFELFGRGKQVGKFAGISQ